MSDVISVDWFHRTEKKYFSKDAPADLTHRFEVPAGYTLEQILEHGYTVERLPKGSARGGCFEIQTDRGIYQSPTGGRINPRTVVFKTWEQLEAEETNG